jgi:hypothetical protein
MTKTVNFLNKTNMKTKMSKQILLLAALGCMTTPVAAQTVDVSINCGQSYTIKSTVDASATGEAEITYRWLENGSTVTLEDPSYTSYTVPATKSVGIYTYIRQAKTEDCDDWQSSNAFTVEVKNKEGIDGECIGGAMWAKYNVDEFGTFAASPEEVGKLYQYNRPTAWPSNTSAKLPAYDVFDPIWAPANDPCPEGWRLPTYADYSALYNAAPYFSTYQSICAGVIVCPKLPCDYDAVLEGRAILAIARQNASYDYPWCGGSFWTDRRFIRQIIPGGDYTPGGSAHPARCVEAQE